MDLQYRYGTVFCTKIKKQQQLLEHRLRFPTSLATVDFSVLDFSYLGISEKIKRFADTTDT